MSKSGKRKRREEEVTIGSPATLRPAPFSAGIDPNDKGHRFGNFSQYYTFHPTKERLQILSKENGILDEVVKHWIDENSQKRDRNGPSFSEPFSYLDLGANEGNLTIDIAREIRSKIQLYMEDQRDYSVSATGLELDSTLVAKANLRASAAREEKGLKLSFRVEDLLSEQLRLPDAYLVSLFSTTMWLHIHGGDEGLRRVLTRICQACRGYLIIEPQPSKKYRDATARLTKLGRPPLNVSVDRLHMRLDIEANIQKILEEAGFQRVDLVENPEERTSWKRLVLIYKRV